MFFHNGEHSFTYRHNIYSNNLKMYKKSFTNLQTYAIIIITYKCMLTSTRT
nr:MAG TPA: hypothetical protein [Caudoviricetes sp.]